MTKGGGKYDAETSELQQRLSAQGVIVMVIGGSKGQGFSVCADLDTMMKLPEMLRFMASQIEDDLIMELAQRNKVADAH